MLRQAQQMGFNKAADMRGGYGPYEDIVLFLGLLPRDRMHFMLVRRFPSLSLHNPPFIHGLFFVILYCYSVPVTVGYCACTDALAGHPQSTSLHPPNQNAG